MLRKLHRTSAVILLVFIIAHLMNHLAALQGIETHTTMLRALRTFYRNPIAETVLLLAALLQVVTGLVLVYRSRRTRRGFWQRVQAWSGIAIAAFLLQHVGAVLFCRYVQQLDTNFYFAAAVLQGGVHKFYFFPYYFAGVTSVFVHLAAVVYLRSTPGMARQIVSATLITSGAVLAFTILLCLGGIFYEVRLPSGYAFP